MSHGGKRAGAGRPPKEPTKVMRIPESKVSMVKNIITGSKVKTPLYGCSVRAGQPTHADDYIEEYLDFNDYLIRHPGDTFIVRASGDSMINAAIDSGDLLVVDKTISATHGKIIIAAVDGELTVKRLFNREGIVKLLPENDAYQEIVISSDNEVMIWGVVINIIKQL
jgi:DNA polymerase V